MGAHWGLNDLTADKGHIMCKMPPAVARYGIEMVFAILVAKVKKSGLHKRGNSKWSWETCFFKSAIKEWEVGTNQERPNIKGYSSSFGIHFIDQTIC